VGESKSSPWIRSPAFDLTFIIGPAWITSIVAVIVGLHAKSEGIEIPSLGPYGWFILVLLVDVAHVYSTLFRTYLDPREREEHRTALVWIPLVAWAVGAILHSIDPALFWRVLTYIAVFHFIRQQYGFLALYGARGRTGVSWLDRAVIYAVTLYPILYWHTHARDFVWFISGDFATGMSVNVEHLARIATIAIFAAWVIEKGIETVRRRCFATPKILWVLGTAMSWNTGIVFFNSDLLFTLTNVVAHGVPYLGLVWLTGRAGAEREPTRELSIGTLRIRSLRLFSVTMIPVYLGSLILLAYLEEGLWDVWIWKDHVAFFPAFHSLFADFHPNAELTAILVAFLTLPQATHYVLDGFIWKMRKHQAWARSLKVV
jgi:hypothetical protein